jgi:prepilin-type N-terminal cleavage/methylation domain-containing protein
MRNAKGFTLVEIMIVVAIIGILIAIAVPSFLRAREISRRNACQENLNKISGATQQWAIDKKIGADGAASWSELIGSDLYLRKSPECPSSGSYELGSDISENPTCSLSSNPAGSEFNHILP